MKTLYCFYLLASLALSCSMAPAMEMVILKNGTTAPRSRVTAILITLDTLLNENPREFWELVATASDASQELRAITLQVLQNPYGLIDAHGKMDDSVKNVILSVTGDGLNRSLEPPYKR